jgi:hypothetical protein
MENQKKFVESLFSKKEQKKLWVLPAITKGEIDLDKERVVTWIHPSGHIGYVVYNDGAGFHGFMMDRLNEKAVSSKIGMCSWCLSVNSMSKLTMFTRKISDNTSLSVRLCTDLNCLESIKNINPNTMRETLTREEKELRYFKHLEEYIFNNVIGR